MNDGLSEEDLARIAKETDWSDLGEIHQTLFCRCGGEWRGHHRIRNINDALVSLPQTGCPKCGKRNDLRKSESDPEAW